MHDVNFSEHLLDVDMEIAVISHMDLEFNDLR